MPRFYEARLRDEAPVKVSRGWKGRGTIDGKLLGIAKLDH